jgi:hypothetical protein
LRGKVHPSFTRTMPQKSSLIGCKNSELAFFVVPLRTHTSAGEQFIWLMLKSKAKFVATSKR